MRNLIVLIPVFMFFALAFSLTKINNKVLVKKEMYFCVSGYLSSEFKDKKMTVDSVEKLGEEAHKKCKIMVNLEQ